MFAWVMHSARVWVREERMGEFHVDGASFTCMPWPGFEFDMQGRAAQDTASLPTPKSSSVQTAERPGGLYAAVAFSGRVDDRDAVQKYESLKERLRSDGVEPSGDALTYF